MLPNTGSKLPRLGVPPSQAEFVRLVSGALRTDLGGTRTATKMIARWTGASDRTARTWMNGLGAPNGLHLICLARESDAVLAAILRMSGHAELMLAADLHAVEVALAKATGTLAMLQLQRDEAITA